MIRPPLCGRIIKLRILASQPWPMVRRRNSPGQFYLAILFGEFDLGWLT
jgi:hypothetical protein